MEHAHGIYACLDDELLVGQTVDVLEKDIFNAFAHQPESADKLVTASEGSLEVDGYAGHHGIYAFVMEVGKAHSVLEQELMTAVLRVVLVVGVVYNALKVTLIVAHLHLQFVLIGHVERV